MKEEVFNMPRHHKKKTMRALARRLRRRKKSEIR